MDGTGPPNTSHTPKGWNPALWDSFWKLAKQMNRQELIVVWLLSSAGKVSDKSFNRDLQDMEKFTKDDLLGIIDEVDPETAKKVVEQYSKL